jgi:isopentenyl-diphosphate delta-isomerase type 1
MAATEHVVLVDKDDNPIGIAGKIQAHREGLCHRAFSIFVFYDGQLLLQQRAKEKYHSPDLWTNTCCSHPRPDEEMIAAGQRRLKEEMGIEVALQVIGRFHYIAHFNNGLTENEIDYVLIGTTPHKIITPNPIEVQTYRWITLPELNRELAAHPEQFTPWFAQALALVTESSQSPL